MNFDWLLYCAITDSCYAVTVQLENNCTATNGTIYTGYAINNIIIIIIIITSNDDIQPSTVITNQSPASGLVLVI